MQKHKYSKMGLFVCVVALATAIQVRAVDLPAASGILGDIGVALSQASTAWAAVAGTGDVDAIDAARTKVKNAKAAMNEGEAAYKKLEGGDENALEDLMAALRKAQGELGGKPEAPAKDGEKYSIPNIHEVLWQSEELKKIYQGLSDINQETSSHGGSDFAERDATDV